MTEHILQFAVNIDDDTIVRQVQDSAVKQITNDIKNAIFQGPYFNQGFTRMGEVLVQNTLRQYRGEIISEAAKLVADSIKKSKKYRETLAEITSNMEVDDNDWK